MMNVECRVMNSANEAGRWYKASVPPAAVLCFVFLAAGGAVALGADRQVDLEKNLNEAHAALRNLPPSGAGLVVLLSLIPVFWGWKVIRIVTCLLFGLGAAAFALGLTRGGVGGMGFVAMAGILGAIVGWWGRRFLGAVWGAAFLAGLLFAIGTPLGGPGVGLGMGAAGGVIGLIVGWTAIQYVDAVITSIGGASVAGAGVAVLAARWGIGAGPWLGVAAAVVLATAGMTVQCRAVAREQTDATGPGTGRRTT